MPKQKLTLYHVYLRGREKPLRLLAGAVHFGPTTLEFTDFAGTVIAQFKNYDGWVRIYED